MATLFTVTGPSLDDVDLYNLYSSSWPGYKVVIPTSSVSLQNMRQLYEQARTLANAESLDLEVIFFTAIEEEMPKETSRWSLGWNDGDRVFIYVFPMEFFNKPDAEQVFKKWLERNQ